MHGVALFIFFECITFSNDLRHLFPLTVHRHAHGDALLESTQLALVASDLVDDAASFVFARVGRVEVLLNRSAEETLKEELTKTPMKHFKGQNVSQCVVLHMHD